MKFGIGSEYPFNIYDRSRLLGGDVNAAVKLHFGAVALCSYTTVIGYGSLLFADNQALRSFGRRRPILHIPVPIMRRSLQTLELLTGPAAALRPHPDAAGHAGLTAAALQLQ